jgi:ribosomal protein S18 acetylase RimI-like enzyme
MLPQDQAQFMPFAVMMKSGQTVVIRPLRDSDGPALADFYEQVPPADQKFYYPHPLTREKALHNAANANNQSDVVLVIDDGQGRIGGYAWFRWQGGSDRSSFGICLLESYKGGGLGRALMAQLAEIARTVGPPVMCLTVQKKNPRAVALYTAMGFRIVRDQLRAGDAEPEYWMERCVR